MPVKSHTLRQNNFIPLMYEDLRDEMNIRIMIHFESELIFWN